MDFESCVNCLHEGSVINFREYTLDRHERRKLTLAIDYGVVQAVIPANQRLNLETLEQYYGKDLDTVDYLQLSQMNCPRVVVGLGLNSNNQLDIKILMLNKDFYDSGLQEIEVINEVHTSEPIYLQAQRGW